MCHSTSAIAQGAPAATAFIWMIIPTTPDAFFACKLSGSHALVRCVAPCLNTSMTNSFRFNTHP